MLLDSFKNLLEVFQNALSLYSLPLKSQFRLLEFYGAAGSGFFTPNFNAVELQGREIVIKAIKVIPFYASDSVDFFVNDGVTTNKETIPANYSINRLFERYTAGTTVKIFLNGATIPIFQDPISGIGNAYLDLDIDNIYYRYPAKLESLQVSVDGTVLQDIETGLNDQPLIKVFIQCYLI